MKVKAKYEKGKILAPGELKNLKCFELEPFLKERRFDERLDEFLFETLREAQRDGIETEF